MKVVRVVLLAAALLFIAVATLTPGASEYTSALRPDFWCLACGASGGADVVVNVVLFIPFGIALALNGHSAFRVLLLGALLSGAIELAQRVGYPPSRVANATDLLTNSLGALIGAALVHSSRYWLVPQKKHAPLLMACSMVWLVSVMTLTGWALSPLPVEPQTTPMVQSPHPFMPGYGWYHGLVSRVTLNDRIFAHSSDGPIVLHGPSSQSRSVRVELTERDERDGFVPMLYIHGASVALPELLLGQEGSDARLAVRLRGSELRLPGPDLVLAGAFTNAGTETQTLEARVTPVEWSLASARGGERAEARLRLSLGVGWTIFQNVVRYATPFAPAITLLWLFVLAMPLGYFGALAAGREADRLLAGRSYRTLLVGMSVLIVTLVVVPQQAGIAATSWMEWVAAFASFASGVFFASRVWRHQQRFDALRAGHQRLSPLQ